MENVLKNLKPDSVFRNFEALTQIPRGSGNEQQISDFLVQFAKKSNLEVIQDKTLNVIINKKATPGYESGKKVILQGHMDMVMVKEEGLDFDFEKDQIPLLVEGDMIKTKGTTLGADNGIAVAMIMSILQSNNIAHPPLTALFTVSEETGMDGVVGLSSDHVSGDILINLDSEEEGVFWTSCAGGVNDIVTLPVKSKDALENSKFYEINIGGLLGGHSGTEINKNRANAIILLGRLLQILDETLEFDISSIQGGNKMNAIPLKSKVVISVQDKELSKLQKVISETQDIFRNEYSSADPNVFIELKSTNNNFKVLSTDTKEKLISILRLIPFGVQTMSNDIEGLVESSNNIGVLETKDDAIIFNNAVRSSVKSRKSEIIKKIEVICNLTGATMELHADYPEWQYKKDSPIRDLMLEVYKEMYGKEAKVEAIHAGLECGFLKEKIGDIDMISMGPSMYDVHTTNERLSISSTERVFDFLCEILKRIK